MECKQVYSYGLKDYFRSYYNFMDWGALALYLASYTLRILVDHNVRAAHDRFREQLDILSKGNLTTDTY
ncbi:Short transient receptor putative channel 2, partial [Cichlidogyrus casuarinus]